MTEKDYSFEARAKQVNPDIVSQLAANAEMEARMRRVYDHIGPHIYNLLLIARNQNAGILAKIGNPGSLAARQYRQFIYAADVLLGLTPSDETLPPAPTTIVAVP